jgi:hypothetical protein
MREEAVLETLEGTGKGLLKIEAFHNWPWGRLLQGKYPGTVLPRSQKDFQV